MNSSLKLIPPCVEAEPRQGFRGLRARSWEHITACTGGSYGTHGWLNSFSNRRVGGEADLHSLPVRVHRVVGGFCSQPNVGCAWHVTHCVVTSTGIILIR